MFKTFFIVYIDMLEGFEAVVFNVEFGLTALQTTSYHLECSRLFLPHCFSESGPGQSSRGSLPVLSVHS